MENEIGGQLTEKTEKVLGTQYNISKHHLEMEGDAEAGKLKKQKEAIVFKKWYAIASWKYTLLNDTCGICRNELQQPCIECQGEGKDQCHIQKGECQHAFHFHCLSRWLNKNNICPLCQKQWNYAQ
ncbi:putative RING-box protein [Blattamonas nauphoetae]|uniref:RING-box protein n=1 Tax=Blattamonas nauphoetae TaxID=2049346 RepID=A0ABQ9XP82_9EUKA|nr:putative RING-box protein [Blattamonas nauphoetae]